MSGKKVAITWYVSPRNSPEGQIKNKIEEIDKKKGADKKVLPPFCPFVAEEIYGNLVATHDQVAPESVHMADWPALTGAADVELDAAMGATRAAVELGRAARTEAKIKNRQPLGEVVVACPPGTADGLNALVALIASELNVHSVRFVTDPGDLVSVTLKPNYRTLGPRFGKQMPLVAAAVADLPAEETVRTLDGGGKVILMIAGSPEPLEPDDLLREARPSEGYAVASDGPIAVGLATEITPDLRLEGLAREVVHAVQNARKAADLRVEQRIRLHLDGSGLIREAIDAHRGHIAAETLADELTVSHGAPFAGIHREEHVLDGEPLAIRIDPISGPSY